MPSISRKKEPDLGMYNEQDVATKGGPSEITVSRSKNRQTYTDNPIPSKFFFSESVLPRVGRIF